MTVREEPDDDTLVIAEWGVLVTGGDAIPAFLSLLRSMPSMSKAETTFSDFARARDMIGEKGDWKAWDDYVIAAQMERVGADEVYSNDSDLGRIKGVRRAF